MNWLPAHRISQFAGFANQGCRGPRSTLMFNDGKWIAVIFFYGLNDFSDAINMVIATVNDIRFSSLIKLPGPIKDRSGA